MTDTNATPWTTPSAAQHPPRLADDALIAFEPGNAGLAEGDAAWIRRWVRTWLPRAPDALVVMGCIGPQSRSARVMALQQVRDVLADCGVPADRIRYTGDALSGPAAPTHGSGRALPSPHAAAWLKVVAMRNIDLDVRPMRSLFQPGTHERGLACTSAS